MNVILDASPLGIGFYHRQARTGISRVIEQLMMGLSRAEDVTLSLAAPTHLPETMRYVVQALGPAAPPFVNSPGEQTVARLENALLRPFAPTSTPTKAIRQLTYQTRRVLNREHARFDLSRLPARAVYHTPFFPAPDAIRQGRPMPLLQSINDLIPIVHPEWFTAGEQTVRQVLATLPPDAWVTTISQATKDDFCNYTGFDPARVVPIRLAASPSLFYPVVDPDRLRTVGQRYGVGDAPYLLSIATLEPRKNIAHLIRCFGELVESRQLPADVRLVLVGTKGWKFDEIMAEAGRSEALRARLVLTGYVPDEDLAPLYSGAVAFVFPSLYEGFGLPPLEAMQCGLPVITSNVSSLPEVVGDAALLVSPTDADALAQAILTIVSSTSVRAELATKAVERAKLFSWDKFISEHVALYNRILEQS